MALTLIGGKYDFRFGLKPIAGTGSGFDHVRDGPAYRIGPGGIYQQYRAKEPRLGHRWDDESLRLSLLHEPVGENKVTNPNAVGAVVGQVGSGGSLPTGWSTVSRGLTVSVEGTGTKDGLRYVDVRFHGTTDSTSDVSFDVLSSSDVEAAEGEVWTGSFFVRLVGGGLTNVNGVRAQVKYTGTSNVAGGLADPADPDTLSDGRITATGEAGSGATHVRPALLIDHAGSGVAADITLRIAHPQIQEQKFADSPIPGPPDGALAATTRPADQLTRVRDWGLADIQDGATWYLDVINEGVFADTGARRIAYKNGDASAAQPADGFRASVAPSNALEWTTRAGEAQAELVSVPAATVNTWAIGDRFRFAFRLIADSGQHRLRIDYRRIEADGTVHDPVIGTASALFDLPTTLSGTLESFFSRGNGVDGAHVAALAHGIVQHTGGTVPTFEALEEELS